MEIVLGWRVGPANGRMPFWLKVLPAFCRCGGGDCMSAQLAVLGTEGGTGEDAILGWLLLAAVLVGVGAGVLLGCLCCWLCAPSAPSRRGRLAAGAAARWEKLVSHALRFVRRRRRIALAFSNLREWPLRTLPTPPRATDRGTRRRRADSQVEPLREGPAAVSHGAHSG
jgi:hypothetical protein